MLNNKNFKKIIEEDFNKEKNYNFIMSKIENNIQKGSFKLRYAYIIAILLIIGVIGVSAGNVIKNYRIETKDNLPFEESAEKQILFDNKLDKEYDSDLFKENNYYTYEEIEEKLELKLLKNKNFDSNIYLLTNLKINNDKIAQVSFWQTNSDKSSKTFLEKYWFYFTINTNYSNEETTAAIIGGKGGEYREHYIKSLNSIALITKPSSSVKCGPTRVHFSYNNIIYSMRFENVCFDGIEVENIEGSSYVPMVESELYDFLEAFTLE